MTLRKSARHAILAATLMLCSFITHADHAADEQDHAEVIAAIGGTHLGATISALLPEPTVAFASEVVAYGSALSLKAFSASLVEPGDRIRSPNSDDLCTFDFELPQGEAIYSNIFGFQNPLDPFPTDWGELGAPQLFHFNTEVGVSIHNPHIRRGFVSARNVHMPAGRHTIEWRADTIVDKGLDIVLPTAMLAMSYSKFKAAKSAPAAVAGNADEAAKQASLFKRAGKWMVTKLKLAVKKGTEKAVDAFILGLIDDATNWEFVSASKSYDQEFTVYDVIPPVVQYNGADQAPNAVLPTIRLEATDFGGVLRYRVVDDLRGNVAAYDPCDRNAGVGHNIPELLRIGANQITWTARDLGPTASGERNQAVAYQTVIVEDTQAPLMITPPGKVIEIDPGQSSQLTADQVVLGMPRVVDLADPAPRVYNNVPAEFPINSRTPVSWTVEDASGNQNTGTQLITVKALGTNTAPTVADIDVQTLTSQPIDVLLTGSDNDEIGGVFDPLDLAVLSRPENGDFIAPLLPYFIEDFRTSPAGPYGEAFFTSDNKSNWLYQNVCNNPEYWQDEAGHQIPANRRIARDFVYRPKFIHVEDDGTYYLIDMYWQCEMSSTSAGTNPRISKWSAEDEFLGQIQYGGSSNTFVVDQDGFLYTFNRSGSSSGRLFLAQVYPDFDGQMSGNGQTGDTWTFDYASTENADRDLDDFIETNSLSYARIDSKRGILYLTDRRRVFVFDVRADLADGVDQSNGPTRDRYWGALHNGEQFLCNRGQHGNSWTGFAMEVDSDGNLYVTDTCDNQIHKFTASYFDDEGNFVKGEHVGWMGRCDTSTNDACDVENQRSRGYACKDDTCPLPNFREENGFNYVGSRGTEPGQFAGPVFIDLDPNDVLYVGDAGRVQRFAKDGTYGGQAKSSGTGINQGDHPGFILGNLGTVKAVTVNSTNFFVVDQQESFIHVFETTPLKDITDNSATVTYVSNFNFHGGVDTFTYGATDGLADSNVGTVRVQVDRNFRPPEAFDQIVELDEDSSLEILLQGDDPDGVIGTDDVFPLDELSFQITASPQFGDLTSNGAAVTYTPDADYHGVDEFQYIANDGVFNSAPATVFVTINPVDDEPEFTRVTRSKRIGRGFPTPIAGDYSDDGADAAAYVWVNWGDNNYDYPGDFVDPDGEGGEPPRLQGVKIVEPPQGIGKGALVADHVYTTTGMVDTELCITTDFEQVQCDQQAVMVESLVSLDLRVTDEPNETTGNYLDLEIELENAEPQGWAGLDAVDVVLNELQVAETSSQIISQSGGCSVANGMLNCSNASLSPGEVISLTVRVARSSNTPLIYDLGVPFALDASTTTPALEDQYSTVRWLTFKADPTDTDNDGMTDVFENTYGLDANNPADAALNSDDDKLTNLQEFERQTNPLLGDTDGDGTRDDEDYCPLDESGVVEGTDGVCETEIRSNAVLRIIQLLSEQSGS